MPHQRAGITGVNKSPLRKKLQMLQFGFLQRFNRATQLVHTVDNQMIIFESFQGSSYSCSPRAIYEAMLQDDRFKSFTFVWAFVNPDKYSYLLKNERTTLVHSGSKEYEHTFSTAKYWVVNAMVPLTIAKDPERQIALQCWHGTPLKRLRNDIVENRPTKLDSSSDIQVLNKLDVPRYDYFISPSEYASTHFKSAFGLTDMNMENIIIETGYPRNDYLTRFTPSDVQTIKTNLKLPQDKKVLLYAPTWRDDQFDGDGVFKFDPKLDFSVLQTTLGNEYILLFRAHSNVADTFNFSAYEGFVYNVSSVENINELYVISDALITDYSSVMFDYANLQRPILFYMYDREHYQKDLRGFYLPIDELPGIITTTQEALLNQLTNLDAYAKETKSAIAAFHQRFNYLDDGNATQRVIDTVWGF